MITPVLLLSIWPRTRQLAKNSYKDWTLFSFMLYGGVIFAIMLVFEEYIHDEIWKIAFWGCLAIGVWIYLRSGSPRKRILVLLVEVTLAYWIAEIGKWHLVPLQTWGQFHGYQHEFYRWFEFWRTLGEWGWIVFFMLIPTLLTLIPQSRKIISNPEEELIPT